MYFVVGRIVVTRGWAGLLGGAGILHQCSCIGGSSKVAITGKEVGKGGELLVQVLKQRVEFASDGSSGGLLLGCCGASRVPGRS